MSYPFFSGYERDEAFPQDTDLSPVPPNNFIQTMPVVSARKAIGMFKDEYLLDLINVEEMEVDKRYYSIP